MEIGGLAVLAVAVLYAVVYTVAKGIAALAKFIYSRWKEK